MKLVERFWAGLHYAAHIFTFSPVELDSGLGVPQWPIFKPDADGSLPLGGGKAPVFRPPNGPEVDDGFRCDYSAMKGWKPCSTPSDRSCWLKHESGKGRFDIHTDYEAVAPKGIVRKYYLEVNNMTLAPDGFLNTQGKVFNSTYPGPWIRACWGDTLEIKVRNNLIYNGTSIHWHGLRQLGSVEMDGVNGVTQCALAPGDTTTYRFNTTQYGTSWYHSHYSLQYADGLAAPLSIYGPTSSPYQASWDPLLITDWNHRSAFQDFYLELNAPLAPGLPPSRGPPNMTNILLNGKGRYACGPTDPCLPESQRPSLYSNTVQRGKRYLLRLINTSVDTTFVFSIDNHNLTVVEADFVPVEPQTVDSILIAIGQRYHVILEANPLSGPDFPPLPSSENFWIRANPAKGCSSFTEPPDPRIGILRYDATSTSDPTSTAGNFSLLCSDEALASLSPVVPWEIPPPANDETFFEAGLIQPSPETAALLPHGNFSRWALGDVPMWLDFGTPTLLFSANNTASFRKEYVIIDASFTANDYVYLVLTSHGLPGNNTQRKFVPAAHPIHLHGHDFGVLQQSTNNDTALRFHNPLRRDVALLPAEGNLVIAFKADNPGVWLMHCHIAWHASSGLALQIMERQQDLVAALRADPQRLAESERVCRNWRRWQSNRKNWWDEVQFQDDSGI